MDKGSARRSLFAQHVLFADLRPDELDRVLGLATERAYAGGQTIFQRGDLGSSLMAVLDERVRISICSEKGKKITLGIADRGDLLGEIPLPDGKDRTADATAMGTYRLLVLDQREFLPFLEHNPSFTGRLLQILCGRMRRATSMGESLALLDIPAKLARLLVQLAELQGEPVGKGRRIGFRLSEQALADLVAAARESVNKHLKLWEEERLIGMDQGRIHAARPRGDAFDGRDRRMSAGTACAPAAIRFRQRRRLLSAAIIALAAAVFAPALALAGPALAAEGVSREVAAAVQAAEEAQTQGQHWQAIEILTDALAEGEGRRGPADMGVLHGSLGNAHLLAREPGRARSHLERSLEIARGQDLAGVEAATLINLGNLHAAEDRLPAALDTYLTAAARAGAAQRPDLAGRARLNAARVLVRQGDVAGAAAHLTEVWSDLRARRGDPDAAFDLLALARLLLDLPPTPARGARAYEALREAAALARASGDDRLLSYATGYMAQLYEAQGRLDEALALSRRAVWLAQAAGSSDPLYAWQRQIGRLLAARGRTAEAIGAYQDAVHTLRDIRLDLPTFDPRTGRSLFREVVGPVFLELTDLLLKQAAETEGIAAQGYLKKARLAIETTKAAELEDYFQDDCVAELQARIRPIDRLAAGTAALYPIMLPDRTELLLSLPDGTIRRAAAALGARAMESEADALRLALETRSNRRYLVPAQNLYNRLLRPFEDELARQRIDTLVFVPDGALRTIPLAALHDGQGFILDRYAVATAPSLNLLDPRPIRRADIKPLLAGLTREVQGFAPLPHVETELQAIAHQHAGVVLLDEAFVAPELQRLLRSTPFSVIHIASHGQFESDPKDSFLLTFDGRLDIDSLERLIEPSRFREEPIELLTLSACTTAAGDDRAALGLAGIAVKAGARSALASLWFINDEASAKLVTAFYHALAEPETSKAEALRKAQLELMQDHRYRHPAYWAPFLIIGNWL